MRIQNTGFGVRSYHWFQRELGCHSATRKEGMRAQGWYEVRDCMGSTCTMPAGSTAWGSRCLLSTTQVSSLNLAQCRHGKQGASSGSARRCGVPARQFSRNKGRRRTRRSRTTRGERGWRGLGGEEKGVVLPGSTETSPFSLLPPSRASFPGLLW